MVTDPIADFVARLLNASRVRQDAVTAPYSRLKHEIADALKDAGFVGAVEKSGKGVQKTLSVGLLYKENGAPRITGAQRISKPGRRLYKGVRDIHSVRYGKGVAIFSTPKGIMTDAGARKAQVGGEELFKMW